MSRFDHAGDSKETANVARFLAERAHSSPGQCAVRIPVGRAGDGRIRYQELNFRELENLAAFAAEEFALR